MRYIKGLTKKNLSKWTGKTWYHQRFDGAPYFMHFIGEGEIITHKRRKLNNSFKVHYCFYDNGQADWYILIDEIETITNSIIQDSKKIPHISTFLIQKWDKDQDRFYKKCLEVGNTNLKELNNKELIKLHDDFVQITINKNSSSSIIDGFALGSDELIADKIKKVYDKSNLKIRFTELFSSLTAPVRLSFINEAEVELLKLAQNPTPENIQEHQKKFFWTRNNYVDDIILDINYFKKEIKKVQSMDINIKKEIKRITDTPKINKQKKDKLIKSLKLSKHLKDLIKISEDFTYWQDERKRSTFWTTHYFSLILVEISKRIKIPLNELKYMTPREMSKIFLKKPLRKELRSRKEKGVFYWDEKGHEALFGKEAEEVKKKILGSIDLSNVNDFRGLTASMGKAIGKVKVLKSVKEITKIEEGDILVAVMTRPEFVPLMKKAKAIITNEGGITTHAAIVSREMKKPCIIGTKVATKIFKDGDLVEVDANKGIVRKINKLKN
jgi:phosphohistidine swiveling domain-containing protein